MSKVEYDTLADRIVLNGKKITRRHSKWAESVLAYVCERIQMGKSILDILPTEPTALPDYIEFQEMLAESKDFSKLYNKAKGFRLEYHQERFVSILNKFKNREDLEELKAIKMAMEKLLEERDLNIEMNYFSIFPDDMWEYDNVGHKEQNLHDLRNK